MLSRRASQLRFIVNHGTKNSCTFRAFSLTAHSSSSFPSLARSSSSSPSLSLALVSSSPRSSSSSSPPSQAVFASTATTNSCVSRSLLRSLQNTAPYLHSRCIASSTSSLPSLTHRHFASFAIVVQPIAESISEGQVAEIKKNVGDAVAANEVVCILETDKVTVDVLSTQSGVVTKVDAAVGDTVQVGATILTIDSDAKATPAASAPVATSANTPASKSQGIASVAPPSTAPAAIAAAPSSSIGGHRRPSIVFTHGAANKAALGSTVAYTVGHKVALVEPAMQSAPKVLGPSGTQPWAPTVLIMDENFFGNPFGVKPLTFDETAMETIMLGGATPDKPKPKDDKKEGKPVKK